MKPPQQACLPGNGESVACIMRINRNAPRFQTLFDYDFTLHVGMNRASVIERSGFIKGVAEILTGLEVPGTEGAARSRDRMRCRITIRPGHRGAHVYCQFRGIELVARDTDYR